MLGKVLGVNHKSEMQERVAEPMIQVISLNQKGLKFQAQATNDWKHWHGPMRTDETFAHNDAEAFEKLKADKGTNKDFDKLLRGWHCRTPRPCYGILVRIENVVAGNFGTRATHGILKHKQCDYNDRFTNLF